MALRQLPSLNFGPLQAPETLGSTGISVGVHRADVELANQSANTSHRPGRVGLACTFPASDQPGSRNTQALSRLHTSALAVPKAENSLPFALPWLVLPPLLGLHLNISLSEPVPEHTSKGGPSVIL